MGTNHCCPKTLKECIFLISILPSFFYLSLSLGNFLCKYPFVCLCICYNLSFFTFSFLFVFYYSSFHLSPFFFNELECAFDVAKYLQYTILERNKTMRNCLINCETITEFLPSFADPLKSFFELNSNNKNI